MDNLPDEIVVDEDPDIRPEEVWDFYVENYCCETRYEKDRATSTLARSDVLVTARH